MSTLADGHLTRPATVEDAVAACCQNPGSRYIAGGTDLVVNMRRGIAQPSLLVDLSGIAELTEIGADAGGVSIGAGVTLAALARHPTGRPSTSTTRRPMARLPGVRPAP